MLSFLFIVAILSGTDPIAVAGLLNASGAPNRLKVSLSCMVLTHTALECTN